MRPRFPHIPVNHWGAAQIKMAGSRADMSQLCYLGIRRCSFSFPMNPPRAHVLISSRFSSLQSTTCILQVGMEHVLIFPVGVNNHILVLGLLSYFQLPAPALSPASLRTCSQSVYCWKAVSDSPRVISALPRRTGRLITFVVFGAVSAWAAIAVGTAWTKCAFLCVSMSVHSHWKHSFLLPALKAWWAFSSVKFLVSKRRCVIYAFSEDGVGSVHFRVLWMHSSFEFTIKQMCFSFFAVSGGKDLDTGFFFSRASEKSNRVYRCLQDTPVNDLPNLVNSLQTLFRHTFCIFSHIINTALEHGISLDSLYGLTCSNP